jgi:GTP diphosphokinase / guanosine-3',5'-bis(diphosphate) 3'-diphosphatase
LTTVSTIMEKIKIYSPDADLKPVMTAYLLAARSHAGQMRKSGEPYLSHPLAVAEILADMRMDVETIATALLHDTLEDNPITLQEMTAEIGPTITGLVDGVTKIGKLKFRSREELAAENFRKMMLAMSKDLRVILVKLADRLHNMSTLEHHAPAKQTQIAEETMEIFVPIANRLGLSHMKAELEDLCLRYIDPDGYARIEEFLQRTQSDRVEYTARICQALQKELDAAGVKGEITGRAKHRSSIWRKMKKGGLELHEVSDLIAFRALVDDVSACYHVLGLVHSKFPPVPDRIKDYVARPKPNGYQSLHTTVIGPEHRRIEVQIRTHDMNSVAEQGIAAHWRYKEGHLALAPEDVVRISRIREAFESAKDADDAQEFMESLKVEFYADEVFVFTPEGDVKRFPMGATALDFAYAVHTDVGQRCTGAKANGRMVPLRYALQSGDSIEVLTSPTQQPSRDWLDIARTGRAISKIRRYLRQEERDQGVRLGREMVDGELKRFGWSLDRCKKEGRLKPALAAFGFKDVEPLLVDVARGQLGLATAMRELLPEGVYQSRQEEAQQNALASILNRFRRTTQSPVLITGEDGLLVHFAKCCAPLPGEPVVGFITRGRGITVHQHTCSQLEGMDPERQLAVEWDRDSALRHSGEIRIYCADKPGMLANITKLCDQNGVNINRAIAESTKGDPAMVRLELAVRDVSELTRLIRNIEKLEGVESVQRTIG